MTLSIWLSRYPVGIIVIVIATLAVFALGYGVSTLNRQRYITRHVKDTVAIEYADLVRRCEVAEAKALAYGIGLRAAGATMHDMADLSDHEVKVVMVGRDGVDDCRK